MALTGTELDVGFETGTDAQRPSVLIVFDDPVNLIAFVAATFKKVFDWDTETAMRRTMEVHNNGRSAVYSGERHEVERYAGQLRSAGLWVSIEKD
jgi:ATP-dependent Clp protease adaptor protein ClpS